MSRERKLTVVLTGDDRGATSALDKLSSHASGIGSKLARAGGIAAAGVGVAAAGLVALGNEVLNTGAQLEAIKIKSDTVFEGMSGSVRKWADANNEAFGLTDDQLLGLAANFGDLLKPMGFTADQAAGMSQEVIGLAGALSSWSGGTITAEGAADKLAAAMLGETDGLKELGIAISAADIDARLLAKGQKDLTGAALEQAKAVATQELIFEKSSDAQKAWAEGGNEALLASNKLKAGFGELKEKITGVLLPAVLGIANKVGPIIADVAGKFGQIFGILFRGDFTSGPFSEDSPFVDSVFNLRDKLLPIFQTTVAWVRDNWPKIQATIQEVAAKVGAIISSLVGLVTALWARWGDDIMGFVQAVWPPILAVISGVMTAIKGVIDIVTGLISGDWDKMWNGIKDLFGGVWEAIVGIVKVAIEMVFTTIKATADLIWGLISETFWGAVGEVTGAWNAITGVVATAVNWLTSTFTTVRDFIAGLWNGIFDGLKGAFNWVLNAIESAVNWVIDFAVNPMINAANFLNPFGDVMGNVGHVNIPELHSGGVFRAPTAGGEGLAVLRDRERVLTPEQDASRSRPMIFNFPGTVLGDERALTAMFARAARRGFAGA